MLINARKTSVPIYRSSPLSYVDLLDAQVARSPGAIALFRGDQTLTYQELDERANQLAGYLIACGVQPEMPVAVCIDRSLAMVVAILGILKAGGAYIPLDPGYPTERLAFILHDTGSRIVVTQSALSGLFQDQPIKVVCLDVDEVELGRFPVTRPKIVISPENLAYVIYTSGSTGRPKGAMITHASLVCFVDIACSALDVYSEDVYLQSASIAYALSVRQLMVPLAVGASIVVASADETSDPLELFRLIKRRGITLMDMVPSFWRSCMQRLSDLPEAEQTDLLDNSLRRIVSIGEALMADLPREWSTRFGQRVRLVNIFGQTETTGVVATYPIPPGGPAGFGIVPIGRSVSQTRLYILDSTLQPVPEGEVGELCVSNPCLARGYLNRPELTSEKFIPNPFADGFSDRLYRTGDTARCRPDGTLEFLGRGDQQVKIRGQRLELGEVESSLRAHPSVRDCVVMARGDNPDDKYLAAYVVNAAASRLSSVDLKNYIRTRLPEYMVPSVIVFLEAFPLNVNGKVNRLALPDPRSMDVREETGERELVLPRNPIEKTIAAIWRQVMNLNRVGVHDNFFDLGGHSLLAVRILTLIDRELGVRLPLTSFIQSATVAQLAELVDRREDEVRAWSPLVPMQTSGSRPPFFGIHAVGGGVLFWRNIVNHLPDNQPFYAIQSQGVDGVRPALHRIEDMARLYVSEIRRIQPHGPYYLGGFSLGGEIAFEMAQQLKRQGEAVDLLVLLDTRNPARVIRPIRIEGDTVVPVVVGLAPASRLEVLVSKVAGHLRKSMQLSPLKSLQYLGKQLGFHAKYWVVAALAGLFRFLGRRLPDQLLIQYLRLNHRLALRNYVPTLYPGRITVFRANESLQSDPTDSPMGWAPLAAAGLEVHYFDTSHEMIKPEYGELVACKLNDCISAALNRRAGTA
jgi:aspartate racemase